MNAKPMLAALALSAAMLGLSSCAEDNEEERDAPASEQSEGGEAEYDD